MQLELMLCGWFVIDTSSRVMVIFRKIGVTSYRSAVTPTAAATAPRAPLRPPLCRTAARSQRAEQARNPLGNYLPVVPTQLF